MIPHLAIFGLVMTLFYSVSVPTVVSEKSFDRLLPEIFETKKFRKKKCREAIFEQVPHLRHSSNMYLRQGIGLSISI